MFDRPVILLAAPRSGSTLLFETLAEAPGVWTVGGESHQFIEGIRQLNPRSGRVDSNRLDASHATEHIIESLHRRFARFVQDRDGREWMRLKQPGDIRFLEKTPKNALRQPFLEKVFPGALYVYLFRDPRPNISSMMEAWKSGRWVTYPRLRGWRGPAWSLLLPPGWQALNGHSLAEICAFQWESANRIILDDLEKIAPNRWMTCDYDDLTTDTEQVIRSICQFAGLEADERLQQRMSGSLPLSRFTHTPPDPEKWRKNQAEIETVLDSVQATWDRCRTKRITVAGKKPC
ncbi:sulfotransferase [Pseudomonadota bacterium]